MRLEIFLMFQKYAGFMCWNLIFELLMQRFIFYSCDDLAAIPAEHTYLLSLQINRTNTYLRSQYYAYIRISFSVNEYINK